MYLLIGLLIVLIVIRIANKMKPRKKKVDMVLVQMEFWKLAEQMQNDGTNKKHGRLTKEFVDICYDLHVFTWGPMAISRGNMPTRINNFGYIQAVTKRPVYRYLKDHDKESN